MGASLSPRELRARSDYYHQLASLLGAGVPVRQAADHLAANASTSNLRRSAAALGVSIDSGATFIEGFRISTPVAGVLDLELLDAGERSGRLEECLRVLSEYYREQASALGRMLGQCVYPALLVHAAVFILPVPKLVLSGDVAGYLWGAAATLVPGYLGVALLAMVFLGKFGPAVADMTQVLAMRLPLIGAIWRDLAMMRLCLALQALLGAGVPMIQAWSQAVDVSGWRALSSEFSTRWRRALEQGGATPAELAASSPLLPALFSSSYHTAEISGSLDDTLTRMRHYYAEEFSRRFQNFASLLPKVVYMLVVGLVAMRIVEGFTATQQQIQQVIQP